MSIDVFETFLASNLVIQYILLINTAPWPWLISAGSCVCQAARRREVKGLSDGNVLLWTGHGAGAGAGISAALPPGKWLFPVLVAPAANKYTQTHIFCGSKCFQLTRPVSLHKKVPSQSLTCSPSFWNRNGCPNFAPSHHNKTHSSKSSGAEWVSVAETESLDQESPAGLLPQPCTLLLPLPTEFWSAHQNLYITLSPKTHIR